VTKHSGYSNYSIAGKAPPVVAELNAVFEQLPDQDLLYQLRGRTRRGPKGYDPQSLWRCYVAYYYLGLESVSSLIRYLHDNPFVAAACGFTSPEEIPSQSTFSRFGTRLAKGTGEFILAVKNVLRDLTTRLYDTFPNFGKSVAIDSTDIKGWPMPAKRAGNVHKANEDTRLESGKSQTPTLDGASNGILRAQNISCMGTRSISWPIPKLNCRWP